MKIKSILKKTFTYKLYRAYIDTKHKRQFEKDCAHLRECGMEVLSKFDACMKELNIPYSLAFGTLLGAVREHGFIKHDDDIDYTMWIDDYRPEMIDALAKYGFKHIHSFSVDGDRLGKEDTFLINDILVDIFYVFPPVDKLPYCCWFVDQPGCRSRKQSIKRYGGLFTRRIEIPIDQSYSRVPFGNLLLPVPVNYSNILRCRYGEDYMIPKPGCKSPTDFIVDWPEKIGIFKSFM